jgi:meiotically up-regulated gene 157 (Mug157) protein
MQPAIAANTGTAVNLPAVNELAAQKVPGTTDPSLALIFESGMLGAERLSFLTADGTIYVSTGDIPAEWLRDSSAQVRPYLYLAAQDETVRLYLRRVIARQGKYLYLDPYANAFKSDYKVWEKKYELDSLLYPIMLAWTYWKVTGDGTVFTADYQRGLLKALKTMQNEQHHREKSSYRHQALSQAGKGSPVGYTGMIWTGFRPSDDASKYHYLIPSEMMAVVALGALAEIERTVYNNQKAANQAATMRLEVHKGIQKFAIVHSKQYGDVYAYEVDGLGHSLLIDDANIPSLLSAPYLGYVSTADQTYQNTRRMLLSTANPNFHSGTVASGIGSEHTPPGMIWPLAILMQAFTADSQSEQDECIRQLLESDPGDHRLHEAFSPDDAHRFTRQDFSWPNALFAEYVLVNYFHLPPLPVPSTADLPAWPTQ